MKEAKMMTTMRYLIVIIFLSLVSSMSGQTQYALRIDRNIRNEAIDITAQYQPRLVMGPEQALEFQFTVAKFLVKRRAVEADPSLSPEARYTLLKRLSSRETSEMADVLESYRWQEYMRIKPQIQPILAPVEVENNLIAQQIDSMD